MDEGRLGIARRRGRKEGAVRVPVPALCARWPRHPPTHGVAVSDQGPTTARIFRMSWMPPVPAENGISPALGIRMRSIIIGLLLIAPPTFAQQSSTAGPGKPQTFSIVALIERELIPAAEPRRETLLACSGNTRTTLVQLNQDQPERLYDTAEVNYYVVAGEGTVRMAGRDTGLAAGSLVALPRGTTHGMVHRGKRPLILLVTLSGSPCEQTR